jgi:hypothetical protein
MSKQEIRRKVSFLRRELKRWHPPAVRAAYENWLAIAEKEVPQSGFGAKLKGSQLSIQGVTG